MTPSRSRAQARQTHDQGPVGRGRTLPEGSPIHARMLGHER
jgi:hypothetical protein